MSTNRFVRGVAFIIVAVAATLGVVAASTNRTGSGRDSASHSTPSTGATTPPPTGATTPPSVNGYLYTTTVEADYLQFTMDNRSLQGTWVTTVQDCNTGVGEEPVNDQSIACHGPANTTKSWTVPITGTVSSSSVQITFGSNAPVFGTLGNGVLTLNVLQNNGSIQAVTYSQAPISAYNAAAASLAPS